MTSTSMPLRKGALPRWLEHAQALLVKYLRGKAGEPRELQQKALAFLGRRGFGYDIARQAVEQALYPAENEPFGS